MRRERLALIGLGSVGAAIGKNLLRARKGAELDKTEP